MSKSAINFCVDSLLALLLVAVLATTALVRFVFPPETEASGWMLWGGDLRYWNNVQAAAVAVFGLCVLLHLILLWTWICGFVTGRISRWRGRRVALHESEKTIYGVGTLIIVLSILGAFVTAAVFAIRRPSDGQEVTTVASIRTRPADLSAPIIPPGGPKGR